MSGSRAVEQLAYCQGQRHLLLVLVAINVRPGMKGVGVSLALFSSFAFLLALGHPLKLIGKKLHSRVKLRRANASKWASMQENLSSVVCE